MYKHRCWFCGAKLTYGKVGTSHRRATTDHIVPRMDGGDNSYSNKIKVCQSCNAKKGSLSIEEFRIIIALRNHALEKPIVSYQFWGERMKEATIDG